MASKLTKQYDPKEAQQRWLDFWEQNGYFHSRPDGREMFAIVIPPPNVTGALHMGHALNNTLQDVLIRWQRMRGRNALWMPGTDHAGIATQAVVERRLRDEEGKTRHDLGRDELVRRIWQWKDQYEARILNQLKQLGCSCDWPRTRFTLDEVCARAVRVTFFKMFKDGYIYRGKRLVNWDTELQTSVANDETYHETVKGGFWTFRYPVKGEPGASATGETQQFIRFSTTRPETMLGDTAVAVYPNDERYRHLIGKTVTIPLVHRDIPIIADGKLVDPALGTGAVKVTPAHDPNDYECGVRNKLPMINILNPDGTINDNGKPYTGLDRFEARRRVVEDMEKLGLFDGREDRDIDIAHSDRSKSPIEPYLSDQWFVKMGDRDDGKPGLARMAMEAVEGGRVTFFPKRYADTYLDWLAEKRDWCISRQLWWGHRIPVWTATIEPGGMVDEQYEAKRAAREEAATREMKEYLAAAGVQPDEYVLDVVEIDGVLTLRCCVRDERGENALRALGAYLDSVVFETIERGKPPKMGLNYVPGFEEATSAARDIQAFHQLVQDPDVLDTWFSSQLWPHSTLGWPELTPELKYYYPTSVLLTSRDIITLWVARMVMAGLYNVGQVPFHHVYIHPKILDAFGETMSKSKGNGIDPLDIIDRYGTDALRFLMVYSATETQDFRMPVSNVCPHCDALVPVKQEHMYMRTRKVTCPQCKKPFRPGGPWPAEDKELPTAKQASERFEMGRNFANKIWNAARFLLLNLEGYAPGALKVEELPIEDRWILSRLATTAKTITEQLEGYHFADVARTLYEFIWSEFCDWYVEMSKGRLRDPSPPSPLPPGERGGGEGRATAQRVLVGVLDSILRLVHPVMPFVAESIWQTLNDAAFERGLPSPEPSAESVVIAQWPEFPESWRDSAMEKRIARMQELVRAVREVRNRYSKDIKDSDKLDLFIRCGAEVAGDFRRLEPFIKQLAGVGKLEAGAGVSKPRQSATCVNPDFEAYVSLAGLIDVPAEIARLQKEREKLEKFLQAARAKLENPNFRDKAPAEVVQEQRDRVADMEKQLRAIEQNLQELQQT